MDYSITIFHLNEIRRLIASYVMELSGMQSGTLSSFLFICILYHQCFSLNAFIEILIRLRTDTQWGMDKEREIELQKKFPAAEPKYTLIFE